MKFDVMGLVFMFVAIWVGNLLAPMLGGYIGLTGGLIGTFITGLVIYAVFCLVSGTKMSIFGGAIFSISVYISAIATGYISGYFGFVTGLVATLVQACVLSLIFSSLAPKKEVARMPVKV